MFIFLVKFEYSYLGQIENLCGTPFQTNLDDSLNYFQCKSMCDSYGNSCVGFFGEVNSYDPLYSATCFLCSKPFGDHTTNFEGYHAYVRKTGKKISISKSNFTVHVKKKLSYFYHSL